MTSIRDLQEAQSVNDGDLFPVAQESSGRTRSVAFSKIAERIDEIVGDQVQVAVDAAERAEAAAASSDAELLREQLADGTTPGDGADLLAFDSTNTVRDKIAAQDQFAADLASTDPGLGAGLVGYNGVTAKFALDGLYSTKPEAVSVSASDLSLQQIIDSGNAVNLDESKTVSAPVELSTDSQKVLSDSRKQVYQETAKTRAMQVVETEFTEINGVAFSQFKQSPPGGGTENDHDTLLFAAAKYPSVTNCSFDGEIGLSFGFGSSSLADRRTLFGLAAFNTATDIWGMYIQVLGSAYNRIVGNALDSATQGNSIGIRLSGYDQTENPAESTDAPCHGVVGTANVLKNIYYGLSLQNSSKYANFSAMHLTDMRAAIHSTAGTVVGNNPTMHRLDFTAAKVNRGIHNFGVNHSKFGFHIDGADFANVIAGSGDYGLEELAGYSGKGFNHYEGLVKNSAQTAFIGRYSHNLYNLQVSNTTLGSGAFISGSYGNGSITVDGVSSNGVYLSGSYNNLQVVATNCPTNGMIVLGSNNTVNIITDSQVTVSGNNNTISGNIAGNLVVTGTGNVFSGHVGGTITKGNGNDYSSVRGFQGSGAVVNATTDAQGRVTLTVPYKHPSSLLATGTASIPGNASSYSVSTVSVGGSDIVFEFRNSSGALLTGTTLNYNYSFICR